MLYSLRRFPCMTHFKILGLQTLEHRELILSVLQNLTWVREGGPYKQYPPSLLSRYERPYLQNKTSLVYYKRK